MPALPEAAVLEHRARGVMARRSGHSTARVCARPAKIQTLERHPVIGRANHRPRAEQLVEAHLAVENVAPDQSETALEVEGRMDLPPKHRLREPGRVAVHRRDDRIGGLLAFVVPAAPVAEIVAKMLAK